LLDEVAKIHPFVGGPLTVTILYPKPRILTIYTTIVAVLAFKGVISLELKRRDNDQKVIALKLQMQEMMAVLLE